MSVFDRKLNLARRMKQPWTLGGIRVTVDGIPKTTGRVIDFVKVFCESEALW